MTTQLRKLIRDRRGAGLTEYIILVGVIALLAIAGFKTFGKDVKKKVEDQAGEVKKIGK